MESDFYVVKDMARLLGISIHATYWRVKAKRGVPPALRVGGRICWRKKDYEKWLENPK